MLHFVTSRLATGMDQPLLEDRGRIATLYRRYRFRVLSAITLGYGLAYTCRLALGVVKEPLIKQNIFTPAELGTIGSALFFAYAFGKLVNGFLADHANMKWFFGIGVLVSALANIGMGFSTTLWLSILLWGINGWFQSFGAPAGIVSLANWFSDHERGRYYGIWSTAHSIGEGLTFVAVAGVAAMFGWRFGFWGPGALGVCVALLLFVFMRDRPRTMGLPEIGDFKNDHWDVTEKQSAKTVLRQQLSILKIPAVWVLALASAANYITRYAINSWGILYLQEARGYSLEGAGTLLMIDTLAGIVGCVAYGFMSDKWFKARRPPANLLFSLIEIAGLGLVFFGPRNNAVLVVGFLLFGFGINGLITSLGGLFAVDISPKRAAGAVMGFVGVFSYLGASLQEQVSGQLIQHGMKVVHGTKVFDFGPAIYFWCGAAIVSLVLASSVWNVKPRD